MHKTETKNIRFTTVIGWLFAFGMVWYVLTLGTSDSGQQQEDVHTVSTYTTDDSQQVGTPIYSCVDNDASDACLAKVNPSINHAPVVKDSKPAKKTATTSTTTNNTAPSHSTVEYKKGDVTVVVDPDASGPKVQKVITPEKTISGVDPSYVNSQCFEDQPCWDCSTMGNKICGPGHN